MMKIHAKGIPAMRVATKTVIIRLRLITARRIRQIPRERQRVTAIVSHMQQLMIELLNPEQSHEQWQCPQTKSLNGRAKPQQIQRHRRRLSVNYVNTQWRQPNLKDRFLLN